VSRTERTSIKNYNSLRQLVSYGLIGIVSNLLGYATYIVFTQFGGTPKLTMTALYVSAATISFVGNRKLTFRSQGRLGKTLLRFTAAHLCGYAVDFLMLYVFVDKLLFPHQLVQGVAIVLVAIFLFFAFKYFVFKEDKQLILPT
jgi:putative flippase GtrA